MRVQMTTIPQTFLLRNDETARWKNFFYLAVSLFRYNFVYL